MLKMLLMRKTLVPSLQNFQNDPFGVRRRGILAPFVHGNVTGDAESGDSRRPKVALM